MVNFPIIEPSGPNIYRGHLAEQREIWSPYTLHQPRYARPSLLILTRSFQEHPSEYNGECPGGDRPVRVHERGLHDCADGARDDGRPGGRRHLRGEGAGSHGLPHTCRSSVIHLRLRVVRAVRCHEVMRPTKL